MSSQSGAPTGRQFELRHGDQHAVAVEIGGGLRTYSAAGRPVLDGYGLSDSCTAGRGQLLIPWPNRINGGRYRFAGQEHQLPLTEPARGNAIHGLVRGLPWTPVEVRPSSVALALELAPQPGYPFALSLRVDYVLDDGGLRSRITVRNSGRSRCPYGAGIHPYLRVSDGSVDTALLQVPADRALSAGERGIPTGEILDVAGTELDFRMPRPIGSTVLDTGYTGLARDTEGVARVTLSAAADGPTVTVRMDAAFRFVMIFTGDTLDAGRRRRGVAIEPMTCAPDAFNSGLGLVELAPGETQTCAWGIDPGSPPSAMR